MQQIQDWEEIVKMQPRGLLTIPRRLRDEKFGANSFVKVKRVGRGLMLEPVTVLGYSVRRYTDAEVGEFFELDKKESNMLKKRGLLK
ncbi:MAG: Uncharacterized protein G01um101416_171 [Microgenomates group bacterium Gr01-1014_16]|nr:MAG: Uncharacterized protein G01um101416_171 [Microgenomates group bacterium Gr01-1014_16]